VAQQAPQKGMTSLFPIRMLRFTVSEETFDVLENRLLPSYPAPLIDNQPVGVDGDIS
jgi:hypothetical protein